MDYTPNQYDNDYARHVKREQELQAQRDAAQRALSASSRSSPGSPHRGHEAFAFLLAVLVGGGVWLWIESETPRMDFWEHILLSFGALLMATWFFTKYRRVTRFIGFAAMGLVVVWIISRSVNG